MRAPSAFNLLNGINWCALAIAIYAPEPMTVEDSFSAYYSGERVRGRMKQQGSDMTIDREKEAYHLRASGIEPDEIDKLLCVKNSRSYIWHYRRRLKGCR